MFSISLKKKQLFFGNTKTASLGGTYTNFLEVFSEAAMPFVTSQKVL